MTQDEKRIKIAEACGWKHHGNRASKHALKWESPFHEYREFPPDYLNDLNAMHEAEESLSRAERAAYAEQLTFAIRDQEEVGFYHERFVCIHLTSAQRAEAFGKTLNLW